jgi:protein-S-isoprenylcysteine O-methyltransferase Ste14
MGRDDVASILHYPSPLRYYSASMDLLRIPLLFATAAAVHKTHTAPAPSASTGERVPITSNLERLYWAIETPYASGRQASKVWSSLYNINKVRYSSYLAQLFAWFASSVEAILILSRYGVFPARWDSSLTRILAPAGVPARFADSLSPMLVLGTLIAVYGAYFRTSAYTALGRHFTFQLALKKDHSLIKAWPYSVVRHPSYTGFYILVLGYAFVVADQTGWVRAVAWPQMMSQGTVMGVLIALAVVRATTHCILAAKMVWDRTASEDVILRKRFGREWDLWAEGVPSRLIPGVY